MPPASSIPIRRRRAAALAKAKADAKAELESYKNADDYREAQQAELAQVIAGGKAAIDAAAEIAGVNEALAVAKAAADAVGTDAQLTAEEEAQKPTNPTEKGKSGDGPCPPLRRAPRLRGGGRSGGGFPQKEKRVKAKQPAGGVPEFGCRRRHRRTYDPRRTNFRGTGGTGWPAFLIGALLAFFTLCLPGRRTGGFGRFEPTIRTTLTDGAVQKGSRKPSMSGRGTGRGNKIASSVTLNGETVSPTWDDSDKTSFTLLFTREGRNTVTVGPLPAYKLPSVTYQLFYQKAEEGEIIGQAVWSVEFFTIGCGYLVEPVEMDIREGENAAEQLLSAFCTAADMWAITAEPQKSSIWRMSGTVRRPEKNTTATPIPECVRRAPLVAPDTGSGIRGFPPF